MRDERGVVLLEALIALAILSTAGLGLVELARAAVVAEQRAAESERSLTAADRVLAAATLLRTNELDQRLGSSEVGEFRLRVQRPERSLYRLSVAESSAPAIELLTTVVYRPEATR